MSKTLTDRIKQLEREITRLNSKVFDLSRNVEETTVRPYSKAGGLKDPSQTRPVDIETGLGSTMGGNITWNNSELIVPPYNQQPSTPTKGYNKHGHSRYAGGALDIHTLELVEFETNDSGEIIGSDGQVVNKHCQQFWKYPPKIAKDGTVEKIGNLDIEFDPTLKKWVAGGGLIDVEQTYIVQYIWKKEGSEVPAGTEGATKEIKLDSNGEAMKSPLLFTTGTEQENLEKSNVVWDKEAKCWRFYAVFKPYLEP